MRYDRLIARYVSAKIVLLNGFCLVVSYRYRIQALRADRGLRNIVTLLVGFYHCVRVIVIVIVIGGLKSMVLTAIEWVL